MKIMWVDVLLAALIAFVIWGYGKAGAAILYAWLMGLYPR